MAETLGSLIDKLCINKIREGNLLRLLVTENTERYRMTLKSVKSQSEALSDEIDSLIAGAVSGQIKSLLEPKNKLYYLDRDNIPEGYGIAENISGLFEANLMLWNLEDIRRDKTKPDDERLEAADLVSTYNQKRNQHVDEINRLFAEKIINKNS